MISGLVISSEGAKTLLIRAVGPTLGTQFGASDALADPRIEIYRRETNGAETLILSTDDWSTDPGADRVTTTAVPAQVGTFPLAVGGKDAASRRHVCGLGSTRCRPGNPVPLPIC